MQRDSYFGFTGIVAVFAMAAVVILAIQSALENPQVLDGLRRLSPWVAQFSKQIAWVATGVVVLTALGIPPILTERKARDGNTRLTKIGAVVWVGCLVPSIGYLVSVCLFGLRGITGG
jgi:hypothetical protein